MSKRTNFLSSPLLIMGVFLVFASSCEKDDDNPASVNPTNGKTTAVFNPAVTYGSMTDQDGSVYKTVTIGTQIWMAENLRTTKYNDGTSIPNITSNSEWGSTTTGAYCNYNNTNSNDTIATFGRLYNWYAVNTGKLAPTGWHVPSDAEWGQLTTYLGGESVAGGKLKETGTTHWDSPNTSATNETGFTALPGGYLNSSGAFYTIGDYGYWWSVTGLDADATYAYCRNVRYNDSNVQGGYDYKELGFSVRCVRD
ncbi:MAG: fibrobacter succinogenes major paralogous domain-containing protein [Flavobacteriales bacterium]|nr:fibrobacter succinogenes major paralogous domain-containing protein [Flavobacteriales bacterium]